MDENKYVKYVNAFCIEQRPLLVAEDGGTLFPLWAHSRQAICTVAEHL